jgi:hypothetical protein
MTKSVWKTTPLCALLVGLSACGTTPPPAPDKVVQATPVAPDFGEVVLGDPELAKATQVASLVLASPHAITAELDSLSSHLTLPISLGKELIDRLGTIPGGGTQIADLVQKLDASAPLAVVWLMGQKAEDQGFCAAMTMAEGIDSQAVKAEFGKETALEAGISQRVDATGTTFFLASKGRTLLVANRRESLLRGGALAIGSQVRRANEQVALALWPQSLAHAAGQTFEQLAQRFSSAIETLPTPTGGQLTAAGRRMMAAGVNLVFGYVAQTQMVRLVFRAEPQRGVVLRTELTPNPNTSLALLTAKTAPYTFDKNLPVKHDGTSVFAWGDIWNWLADVQKVFQATGKAGERLAAEWHKLHGETVSAASCSLDFSTSAWLLVCSYDLRKGVDPAKSLDSFVAMYQAQNDWAAELESRKATPLKVKRGKGTVSIEQKMESADKKALALMKSIAGSDGLHITFATAQGRVVQSISPKPINPLSVYGKGQGALPPILAASLAQTKGAEMMASIEPVSPLLHLLPKLAGEQMGSVISMLYVLPGGKDLHVPALLTLRGGEVLAGELQFPIAGLETLGKVLGGLMGQPAR